MLILSRVKIETMDTPKAVALFAGIEALSSFVDLRKFLESKSWLERKITRPSDSHVIVSDDYDNLLSRNFMITGSSTAIVQFAMPFCLIYAIRNDQVETQKLIITMIGGRLLYQTVARYRISNDIEDGWTFDAFRSCLGIVAYFYSCR